MANFLSKLTNIKKPKNNRSVIQQVLSSPSIKGNEVATIEVDSD